MTRRKKTLLRVAAGLAGVFLLLAGWVYVTLQSEWFFNQVRTRIISTLETATGGKVELGAFQFDRANFSAEVRELVLHGTEAANQPPLLRVARARVGLKLLSVIKPSVDILSLDVAGPQFHLIIAPDGRTNFPEPKVKRQTKTNALQSILDLEVDRFRIHDGVFEIDGQGRTPIDFAGRNLAIQLGYEASGPRYRGTLHTDPVMVTLMDYDAQPFTVNLGLVIENNRIVIENGRLSTASTTVDVRGALMDLAAPHAEFQYAARTVLQDIGHIFRVPELRRGAGMSSGTGTWRPGDGLRLRGAFHGTGAEYLDKSVHLDGVRADGEVDIADGKVNARGTRISGFFVRPVGREPVEGTVAHFQIDGRDLEATGIALTMLGGSFRGQMRVRGLERYLADGEIAGVQAARTVALYSPQKLPWDALVYGAVRVQGSFHQPLDLKAGGELTLAPAASGDPVNGRVTAQWDARASTLDLGRSAVTLPHSRAEFSGILGAQMRVRLETRDLNDLLPALGANTGDVPVKLNNGSALFEGTVTGNFAAMRVIGHLRATGVTYAGQAADSVEADVLASPEVIRLQNGVIVRGALRAQAQGSLVLSDWKTSGSSPVAATITSRNAPLADALALAGASSLTATGTLGLTVFVSGTLDAPRIEGDLEATRGTIQREPFDRIAGHVVYSGHVVEIRQGQLTAGPKQARLNASYDYEPGHMDRGRLRFDLATNTLPLDSIKLLVESREDLSGTVAASLRGEAVIDAKSKTPWRLTTLDGNITGKALELGDQPVGDLQLTLRSQNGALRVHLDSTAAGAQVLGDGEWRLSGDYPGKAAITFSKLDLGNLRAWVTAGQTTGLTGSMDGELRIDGPALNWSGLQAELRIPRLEIGPAPNSSLASAPLRVTNQGPLVARYAKSVVTVDSVHLVGRGTDLTVAGRVLTDQKQPLDLKVDGHADLSFLQDFMADVVANGTVATTVTIRGSFSDPQILGRLEFQRAAFNITDVPNGISNATGVVAFTKDRATIQTLTGETGGGRIDLSGFVQYGGGSIVFRLHARAREVRVRYPEGVSTLANANLNLTGTQDSSTLAGSITILRTGINLQSDFSSFLAKSAEPVKTPSAQPGLLGGMSFDVQVETAPETQFETSLTEGIQAEANLRLRGTVSNPAVLGRVTVTQGKLQFFGTQYSVSQGTINFYNPVKVEPVVNIDLETKARGIDITLSVSGPLNKLTLTPRSDPPLQFSEIVALLAQGRAPTSDPSLMRQRTDSPQTFQQAGASALLGSAIANPVAGRLQRFFGVSKLRIDPSLSGVENNPQARLTLEQQITPNLTFTYITNVTSSNPQIIRMEWAISKTWSVVALREENGLLGLDFFYKKRFK